MYEVLEDVVSYITDTLIADMFDVPDEYRDQYLENSYRVTCKYCGEYGFMWHQVCTESKMTWILVDEEGVQHRCLDRSNLGENPNVKIWGAKKS